MEHTGQNRQRKKETGESWPAPPRSTSPPRTKSSEREESALCEISMSQGKLKKKKKIKIPSQVVVIPRFGPDTPALLDKLSALTPVKPHPAPEPGKPLSSPPPPTPARSHAAKIPSGEGGIFFPHAVIKRLSLQSRLDEKQQMVLIRRSLGRRRHAHLRIIYWTTN